LERTTARPSAENHCPLSADEFIPAILLHVYPVGSTAFLLTGFLGTTPEKEVGALPQLSWHGSPNQSSSEPAYQRTIVTDTRGSRPLLRECPICHRGRMITVTILAPVVSSRPSMTLMIDPVRLQLALSKNSRSSSSGSGVFLRHSKPHAVGRAPAFCPTRASGRPQSQHTKRVFAITYALFPHGPSTHNQNP